MESVLSLFIFHDSYIVSFLVMAITVVVIILLLFNHKSPESVIKNEIGGGENIEGALRRVLGEQRWMQASQDPEQEHTGARAEELEKELLDKDRKIAELNKKLTQGGTSLASHTASLGVHQSQGDNSELLNKITELEGKLHEYEIIEDDIADLSLYRTENEKLKAELARLKGLAVGEGTAQEEPSGAEKTTSPPKDFVAEFEKVVISQEKLMDGNDVKIKIQGEVGNLVTSEDIRISGGDRPDAHPKLRNINPDSKEEAEVFISELKSLKKG